MTFRLVTLMSVVLLLSLAAFGLLMAHYQDEVMAEVANTASAVGQATLLELRDAFVGRREEGNLLLWKAAQQDGGAADAQGGPLLGQAHFAQVLVHVGDDAAACGDEAAGAAAAGPGADPTPTRMFEYVIDVEEVRAESDPARGLVLTIPRFAPEPGEVAPADAPGAAEPDLGPSRVVTRRREEVRLPIPVREYDELFAAFRRRSLVLFVGVFAVGLVLSTGLATHFTRPIRKLDGAIRKLSEGDLDVSVPVQGRDEIGRLSRAFNEMAGRLRAGRERGREMVRREKLSALGRMAAGVAHDVRNPLHSIGLTLQHLKETARPAEAERAGEFDRGIAIIRGEIRRLDRLIENFLQFARSERHERRPVDLAELLRETARLVQKEADRRGIRIGLELAPEAPPLHADGEALRSAILNLVLNSFEAMPEGGELTLRLAHAGAELALEVADTGAGIPEADLERVFDFAYTTRDGGHGLGLAMVHHCVVEQHGGRVALDSRPGAGTRVRLELPLGEAAAS
jgi:signal transduction histidine kinase